MAGNNTRRTGVVTSELADSMSSGDLRQQLEALRDRLTKELESLTGRDVAPVARQLTLVCKDLATMPAAKKSTLDDLAERRRARRAPDVADGTGGTVVRG